jgi:hypothetical protein
MSVIFLKRINKEIEDFNNLNYINKNLSKYDINFLNKICVNVFDDNNKFYLNVNYNNSHLMTLQIPVTYPFIPLKIYNMSKIINNKLIIINNYSNYLNELYKQLNSKNINFEILEFFFKIMYKKSCKFLNNFSNNSCFCCSSITCSNTWNPGCRFNDILLEYNEILFIEKYSQYLNYKKLNNVYNELIKNSIISKLPNELINIILSYC